jgi:hypothetical protein
MEYTFGTTVDPQYLWFCSSKETITEEKLDMPKTHKAQHDTADAAFIFL